MPDFATPKGKAAFARKMAESVALVADPVLREAVIHNVSARLEMAPAQFAGLIQSAPKPGRLRTSREFDEQEPEAAEPTQPRLAPMSNTTRMLCQLALLSSEVRAWLFAQPWEALFEAMPEAELLLMVMRGRFDPSIPASVTSFLSTCDAEVQAVLAGLLDLKQLPADPLRVASDCWRDLERRELERQRDALQARIRKPGLEFEEHAKLHAAVMEIQQRMNAMRA